MIREQLIDHLMDMVKTESWEECHECAKAIFTAICHICNIEIDTFESDKLLLQVYNNSDVKMTDTYEAFENFMIEHLV